ncbi:MULTISPECIES: DUF6168 family protein [unclassified Mangrovimonas]|uniref:DUF6168 family protein n=1 Tax=unclassified Mangrovimonas TaxID=2622855 RepID=UPI0006B54C78|nr:MULTISPECIES: DUF6168 family protein [unclassified Mangrovimonas]NIK90844.1 hypothetical protein [Mangrovimonas sp. CR14]
MNKKRLFIYLLIIAITSLIAFFIHTVVLKQMELPPYEHKIVLAYIVNTCLAMGILFCLYFFKEKFRDQLGFLFMLGSFLKFIFFFILFYPAYHADNEVSTLEFTSFFVPYATSLITETFGGVRLLNSLD